MEWIILFMDHNKQVYDGTLGKALSDKKGLNLNKVILQCTGELTRAACFRGSKQTNGLWASSDLKISNTCIMPLGFGVGNHQAFITDIPLESLVGEIPVKIVRPAGPKSNSQLPQCGDEFSRSLKKGIIQHRLLEPLHDAHTRDFTPEERTNIVIGIDKEGKTYMLHVEKICRKIKLCQIPFSPKAFIWILRIQIY